MEKQKIPKMKRMKSAFFPTEKENILPLRLMTDGTKYPQAKAPQALLTLQPVISQTQARFT